MRYSFAPINRLLTLLLLLSSLSLNEKHSLFIVNKFQIVISRSTHHLQNHNNLCCVCISWKQYHALHEFSKNTSNRPQIKTLVIRFIQQAYFWSSVPSCNNINSFDKFIFDLSKSSRKTKVTDFQITI